MLFYIFLFSFVPLIFWIVWRKLAGRKVTLDDFLLTPAYFYSLGSICMMMMSFGSWLCHSSELGFIVAQQEIIDVAVTEVEELKETLAGFEFPEASLMNRDTPVESIVAELSRWQKISTDAKLNMGRAKRSIEQRRLGPMSGVISFVGDYK